MAPVISGSKTKTKIPTFSWKFITHFDDAKSGGRNKTSVILIIFNKNPKQT